MTNPTRKAATMAAGYQATDTMIQLSLEVQVESRVVSLLKLLRDMLKSWDLEGR